MDKKIANSLIVGVVVTLGFLGFVFVLFTMGSGGVFTKSYPLKAKFTKVNGLSINSGEHFEITYTSTAVTLSVVSGP